MNKFEREFLNVLSPHMNVVAKKCSDIGMPMFSTLQIGPNEFRTFCVNEEKSNWFKIKMMSYIDKTWSFDEFLELLMQEAIKDGHDSQFLEAMGIPKTPDRTAHQPQDRVKEIRILMGNNNKN